MKVTKSVIAKNEMFVLRRAHSEPDGKDVGDRFFDWLDQPRSPPFDDWLETYLAAIDKVFSAQGLPAARQWVVSLGSGWKSAQEPEASATHTEGKQLGHEYVRATCELLSREEWLARIAGLIIELLEETDPNQRLHLALMLGEERARLKASQFQSAVAQGRSTQIGREFAARERYHDQRSDILKRMGALIDKGKNVNAAARQVFDAGVGTSAAGNRSIWRSFERKRIKLVNHRSAKLRR